MDIEMPDGTIIEGVPDGITKSQLMARYQKSAVKSPETPSVPEGYGFTDMPKNEAERQASREMDKSIAARLGRIGISGIAAPADLIYAAGSVPYNVVRGVQQVMGADVAPPITIPSPGEAARASYDRLTNNAGQSEGLGKIADTAAEYIASAGGLGKLLPSMTMKTGTDVAANAAAGAAGEYTKQELSDSPVAQMAASIAAALGVQGIGGAVSKAATRTTPLITAENKVLQRLGEGDVNPASLKAGRPLIDVGGKNVERLGEAVANIPGKGADIAEKFVGQRVAESGKNIKKSISDYISSGGDANETVDAIIKAGRERAAPKYKAAYAVDIIPDKQLKEIMKRPSMVQAARNAERIAADEGQDLSKLVTKTEFYDYVKRGLDDVLEGYRDKTTGKMVLDTQGRAIEGLRKNYVEMIKKRNPLYKDALEESSTYFESKNAVQSGIDFMDKTPIQLQRGMKGMSKTDRELFKFGVASKMREMVDSANIGTDLGRKVFVKQEQRDALRAVLEPKEYGKLKRSLEQQAQMHKLNQRLVGNSRTQLRKEEIDDLMQDPSELLSMATSPARFGIGKVTQFISNKYQGLNKETSAEIAKILFETNPAKQKDIIYRLQKRAATGYKPALRGTVILNKMGDITKNTATLNAINQGE